jgi:hypothetical protein
VKSASANPSMLKELPRDFAGENGLWSLAVVLGRLAISAEELSERGREKHTW